MPVLTLLAAERLSILAPGSVLAPEDLAQLAQAQSLVEAGRLRAEQSLAQAQRRAQQQLRAGFEQGLKAGAEAVARRLLAYERSHAAEQAAREQQLVELVGLVLARLAPQLDRGELVRALVRSAIAEALQSRRVVIKVAVELVELVERDLGALQLAYPWVETLEVIGTEELGTDDCLLETPHGDVNASWSTQLAAIRALLTDSARAADMAAEQAA